MSGERLQWHTAGILWHRSTPPGCFFLSPFPAFQLSAVLSLLPISPPPHSSLPSHSPSPGLMSQNWSLLLFLLLSCPSSFLTLHCFSTQFSAHLLTLLPFYYSSPSLLFSLPLPDPLSTSVILSSLLWCIGALQCTVWMSNESYVFYKPQPSPISILYPSSAFLSSFLPLYLPSTFAYSLFLYLLARSHATVYKEVELPKGSQKECGVGLVPSSFFSFYFSLWGRVRGLKTSVGTNRWRILLYLAIVHICAHTVLVPLKHQTR